MKRTVAIQDVHYAHGKPRHNQVLHVYHNWTDEELKDEADVVRKNDIEFRRLKRFIDAHDEIVDLLRNAAKIAFDITAGDFDHGDVFNLLNQVDVLLECIDGKEAI